MPEVIFELQVITPLFLAGSNQREIDIPERDQKEHEKTTALELQPELRSPSFRGLMRYWLRAAAAGLVSTRTIGLESIRDFEQFIFGATDQGSAIQVRIRTISQSIQQFRKESHSQDQITGKDYLYWSMDKSGKGNRYKPARYFLTQDTNLSVTLSVHGQGDNQARQLECAIASFWLLLMLGGLGSRSRRCAGSFAVTKVSGNITKLSFTGARDAPEELYILRQGIQEVKQIFSTQFTEGKNAPRNTSLMSKGSVDFDMLSLPDACRIWVLRRKDGSSWYSTNDALADIGKELQAGRKGIASLQKRTVFGLPLMVREMDKSKLKDALEKYRRASPLHLKISRLQDGKYVGIAVLFKTYYRSIENILPEPEYGLIEDWIENNLTRMTALEVKL